MPFYRALLRWGLGARREGEIVMLFWALELYFRAMEAR